MIWAVQVMTGVETDVRKRIREACNGVTVSVPERELFEKHGLKWTLVRRVMIPGYVFCEFEADKLLDAERWHQIKDVPGVIHIIGMLDPEDCARLRVLGNGGEPWGVSYIHMEHHMGKNQFHVDAGPLKSEACDGWKLVKVDAHRRRGTILIRIGTEEKRIDLGIVIEK